MVITREQVDEVAAKLGYDDEAVEVVIRRAGTLAEAHKRLRRKLASQEREVNAIHEKRIVDQMVERARARHARRQAKARGERQAERSETALPKRLAECLEVAATFSAVPAAGIAGSGVSTGKKVSVAPPGVTNDVLDFYLPRFRALIGNFERAIDAELLGATASAETPEERDLRIVREYEGWGAHEVATFDHSVGVPKTVERARRKHGRTAARGYKLGVVA